MLSSPSLSCVYLPRHARGPSGRAYLTNGAVAGGGGVVVTVVFALHFLPTYLPQVSKYCTEYLPNLNTHTIVTMVV